MIDLAEIYLKNIAKRAIKGEHIGSGEIAKLPRLIDKTYGDDDGVFELSDVVDAATDIVSDVADKAESVWDVITSIF